MIPASLLVTGGMELPEHGPDAQVSIGDCEPRELQSALSQATQDR